MIVVILTLTLGSILGILKDVHPLQLVPIMIAARTQTLGPIISLRRRRHSNSESTVVVVMVVVVVVGLK